MAAPTEGPAFVAAVEKNWGAVVRSPEGTPQKVRQLIDEGIAPEEGGVDTKDTLVTDQSVNGSPQAEQSSLESTSREAFFSRVETFSSLKWAGKPLELSPLVCAKYGWVTVECDMLKCSSCQAFLCASLQLAFDFNRYKERCAELKKALCTAHEKFCFWPDSPSPDRFGMLPLDEPDVLLCEVVDRFQGLCHLDLQLPSLRPEDLKTMCFTEDKISLLLQLLEEELDHRAGEKKMTTKLGSDIQVHVTACILSVCGWACRMMTRSQDATVPLGSEQVEKSPGPIVSRTRSWDSSSPVDRPEPEAASPTPRSRPVTRSMGTGDTPGIEVPSSPLRRAKRARLCSSSSSDTASRSFFDPTSQHRDWCPWLVSLQSLSEKSRKVFRIFRQWESLCSA
ncbi:nuclear-interacting partner of ALK [Echinops telfairi]|uniref:Nuclear-interacting partner of ALK n=1 Tax=Echinops telfairi TaxID=9371 RepID=A0AC55CZD5_ECHTE|nr:nuclear-interacting partner of ALK [Echinops telfairi]